MIHESWKGNGFCYRRFDKLTRSTEYLGYAGYFGAWTDNPQYYERRTVANSLFHRNALVLKWVCYLAFKAVVDSVKINRKSPIYDVFVYHGA
mmetsp:Transcript_18049/g.30778  ORF Transcript_18049/g.30778 Transcript_18049/m.30778 type:complete len:92 (+) Transcript_18049:461-736(+)